MLSSGLIMYQNGVLIEVAKRLNNVQEVECHYVTLNWMKFLK